MPELVKDLARNLAAGTRLALFFPVRRLDYRVSGAHFAVLLAFNCVVWLAAATLREGRYGQLEPLAVTSYLAGALLVLFTGLVVARIYRDPAAALIVAVALMASDLVLELSGTAFVMLAPPQWAAAVYAAFIGWIWVVSVRAVAVCAGTRRPQLYLGALAASALIAVMLYVFPRSDVWAPGEAPAAPALADERVFQLQGELLARALDSLAPGAAGETELYFIGFAPDGSQDVFLREMRYVKRLVEERYAAGRRSLVLANGDGALREFPVASATSLRKALAQVGARMNADEDVLLLYLSAHGDRNFELSARQPPLVLATLNPTALARMLQDSAIRWKVVIVSACHAGGFIEPLKDANTLVIAAARADRTSFGCAHGRDFTYFGRAFFRDALAQTRSFAQAFETARNIVAQQEKAEGLEPSEPQMWVGEAIAERLKPLER